MTGPVTEQWLSCGVGDFIGVAIFIFVVARIIASMRQAGGSKPQQPFEIGPTESRTQSSGSPEDELKRFLQSLGGETVQEPAVPPPVPQVQKPRKVVKPPPTPPAVLQRRQEIAEAFQEQAPEPKTPRIPSRPMSSKKSAQEEASEKKLDDLRQILRKTDSQRQAITLSEILGLPVGSRREHPAYYH